MICKINLIRKVCSFCYVLFWLSTLNIARTIVSRSMHANTGEESCNSKSDFDMWRLEVKVISKFSCFHSNSVQVERKKKKKAYFFSLYFKVNSCSEKEKYIAVGDLNLNFSSWLMDICCPFIDLRVEKGFFLYGLMPKFVCQ